MTGRDRIVIVGLAPLAVLAAVWLLAVAPEREKAPELAAEVSAVQPQLATAESQSSAPRRAGAVPERVRVAREPRQPSRPIRKCPR